MIKLFTHTDLDGVGCAILSHIAFGSDVEIEHCTYKNVNTIIQNFIENISNADSQKYDFCFITDISVNDSVASLIDSSELNFALLDHHATAEHLNTFNWAVVSEYNKSSEKTSGTELFYIYLKQHNLLNESSTLDTFVKLVSDQDTWRWVDLGEWGELCRNINYLLYLYGRDKFIDKMLEQISTNRFPTLSESDLAVLEVRQREFDNYIFYKKQQIVKTTIQGKKCAVVIADRNVSELGNAICESNDDIDFAVIIDFSSGSLHYRTTKDDIDVSEIASCYGGGGHSKASGSHIPDNLKNMIIKQIFE